jgi:hypothetical protein
MPIDIPEDRNNAPTTPVMKRTAIGERTRLAIVRFEQRPIKKDGADVINPKTGKPRQELVVHGLAMEGTTAPCGKGDDQWVPAVGTPVRVILKGAGFGAWIEARKTHRNLGFYGPLKLVEGSDAASIAAAEKAYLEATAITLDAPKATTPAPAPADEAW